MYCGKGYGNRIGFVGDSIVVNDCGFMKLGRWEEVIGWGRGLL